MSNNIFNVNWSRLVIMLIPVSLRKPLLIAFLNSCIEPLKSDYKDFLKFKADAEYRVKHNGQIVYLQKMLNDKFDNYLRRIKVENIPPKQPLWVYYAEDEKPIYVYNEEDEKPLYVYNAEDYYNEFDFRVIIPPSLADKQNQMMAQINYYKLFSKNYQITTL